MPGSNRIDDEDFIADCRQTGKKEAAEHGLLPYHQRRLSQRPACKACGQRFTPDELIEDGLCGECDKTVKDLEDGKT
jgi:hypothetical protein